MVYSTPTCRDYPQLSIQDVSQRLNMSACFVYNEVTKGNLEHYAMGGTARKKGRIRISENQLDRYLAQQLDKSKARKQVYIAGSATAITQPKSQISQRLNKAILQGRP